LSSYFQTGCKWRWPCQIVPYRWLVLLSVTSRNTRSCRRGPCPCCTLYHLYVGLMCLLL